jgi:glycerophosphoryl diester phosphodiesterase
MRLIILFIAVTLGVNSAYAQPYPIKFKNVAALQKFMKWTPERYPLVSCHRGGVTVGFPENAIETLKTATNYIPV